MEEGQLPGTGVEEVTVTHPTWVARSIPTTSLPLAFIPEPKVWALSWHLHTGTAAEQKTLELSHARPLPHVPYPESQGT